MKVRYYVDEDDWFRRFFLPWLIGIAATVLAIFGIKMLAGYIISNTAEHKREVEISEDLKRAPEKDDYRDNIPDEQLGNYEYKGNNVTDYSGEIFYVTKIVDAENLMVRYKGEDYVVRLIGVDVPDCYASETIEYLTDFLNDVNYRVKLEFDDKYGYFDEYGNIAAYVTTKSVMLNSSMIINGYASAWRNKEYEGLNAFLYSESFARGIPQGLWRQCSSAKNQV